MKKENAFNMKEFREGMQASGMQVFVIDENFHFPTKEEVEQARR